MNKETLEPPKKNTEQLAFERKETKVRLQTKQRAIMRAIEFKEDQLKNNLIVETRTTHQIPDGTVVVVDGYIDRIKPEFLLRNEIEELHMETDLISARIKTISGAEEQDARKTTKPGG